MTLATLTRMAAYEIVPSGGRMGFTDFGQKVAEPMPRSSGIRLGTYDVLEPLGAGGPAAVRVSNPMPELQRGLVRLRSEAASTRPRRSSARVTAERRRTVEHQIRR